MTCKKIFNLLFCFALLLSAGSCIKERTLEDYIGENHDEPTVPAPVVKDDAYREEKYGINYVYDESVIPEVHINVTLEEWNKLLKAYDKDSNTKDQVLCSVRYIKEDEVSEVSDAAIRLKGNTSRRRPEGNGREMHVKDSKNWRRVHYQVNLYKYVKDDEHTIHGARKITFKYAKEDPSYIRERYCYDLFQRAGAWVGAHSNFCRLYIKVSGDSEEVYLGIYDMIEPVDDEYLKCRKDRLGGSDGFLWKCRYGASLTDTGADMGADLDDGREHQYELKTEIERIDEAKDQLRDFIKNLNRLNGKDFHDWIDSHCDVDMLLRTYAVNVVTGMWDDYWNNTNNYYIYFNSTDSKEYKFYFIPYDYDNTLGTSNNCGVQNDSGRQDPFNWGDSGRSPLIAKIISFDDYREIYSRYLKDLTDSAKQLGDYASSTRRIQNWQSLISPFVSNDTGEDMSIKDKPASWGNHGEYRLLENNADKNWFLVKSSTIAKYCK